MMKISKIETITCLECVQTTAVCVANCLQWFAGVPACLRLLCVKFWLFSLGFGSTSVKNQLKKVITTKNCWISMDFHDFKDFIKSDSAISTGMAIQSCSGQFSPRKRTFQRRLIKFELFFSSFSTLSGRFGVVEITRCGQKLQNDQNL